MPKPAVTQRGIFSIEKGARLIEALTRHGSAMPLSALAAAAGLAPSIAHRYLVSLVRGKLVEQLPNGSYDLGALALAAGMAKLSRQDSYRVGLTYLDELSERSHETVLMAIWSGQAVVAVRWVESRNVLNVHVRPGASLPFMNSASGRVFAAFLPPATTAKIADQEWAAGIRPMADGKALRRDEFDRLIADVRTRGMARVLGDLTPGVSALAAPVFSIQHEITLVFTVMGPMGTFDTSWEGEPAKILRAVAQDCTTALSGL